MWQHDFSQTEEATNKISAPGYYLSQFLRSQYRLELKLNVHDAQ